jgi:hypothetical protein
VAGCCELGNEPSHSLNAENLLIGSATVSFSRRPLLRGVIYIVFITLLQLLFRWVTCSVSAFKSRVTVTAVVK